MPCMTCHARARLMRPAVLSIRPQSPPFETACAKLLAARDSHNFSIPLKTIVDSLSNPWSLIQLSTSTHPYLIGVNVALPLSTLCGRRRWHERGFPAEVARRSGRTATTAAASSASSNGAAAAAVREVVGAVVVLLPDQLRLHHADRARRRGVPKIWPR